MSTESQVHQRQSLRPNKPAPPVPTSMPPLSLPPPRPVPQIPDQPSSPPPQPPAKAVAPHTSEKPDDLQGQDMASAPASSGSPTGSPSLSKKVSTLSLRPAPPSGNVPDQPTSPSHARVSSAGSNPRNSSEYQKPTRAAPTLRRPLPTPPTTDSQPLSPTSKSNDPAMISPVVSDGKSPRPMPGLTRPLPPSQIDDSAPLSPSSSTADSDASSPHTSDDSDHTPTGTPHEGEETPLEGSESPAVAGDHVGSDGTLVDSKSSDDVRAGRRLPSRPAALSKTQKTSNLPNMRPAAVEAPKKTAPAIPKKGVTRSVVIAAINGEGAALTPDDFDWSAQRSASMSAADHVLIPIEPVEASPSSAKTAHRNFALNPNPGFAGRKASLSESSGTAPPLAAAPSTPNVANPRDSAAIVLKLGIQTAETETPEMMKTRGNLADEILKTEAVYLEDLRLIVSKFLAPMRANMKIISATDLGKLYLNIESLELISEEIHSAMNLAFMEASTSAQVSLAPVYLQFTETMLQGFSLYCAGHSESLSLLTRLKKKQPTFTAYLEQLEADEALGRLKLADFLTRPIQHICRQPLLLRELLKSTPQTHSDYEDLIFALDRINDLVDRVNSNAKEVGNLQAITNFENSVDGLPEGLKLLMPGRYMLREGRFLKISNKLGKGPVEHFLFLFSDMLVLTKPKQFGDAEYQFTELFPLHQMLVEDLPDSDDYKNAFSVTSLLSLRSHTFVAKDEKKNNEIIKRDWLSSISTTKSRFEKGLAGQLDDASDGVGFKVQQASDSSGFINPFVAMRDQLSSVSVQLRIGGWKGSDVLKEVWMQNNASNPSPTATFVMPLLIKFNMEAPAALRVVAPDDAELIENECFIFLFEEFLVFATEKKDVQVKKPFDWFDYIIYSSCVMADSEGSVQEKKIKQGRTVFPLSLISASTRKKFVLYFRSDTVKKTVYQILSTKMPAFLDTGAVNGVSTSSSSSHKRDKSSTKESDDTSTLRTKKSFFGRKLGYRTASQTASTTAACTGCNDPAHGHQTDTVASTKRMHSHSALPIAHGGAPTPFLASSVSSGSLNISPSSSSHSLGSQNDEDDEPDKLLTAEGYEVPPWAPDDSSHVCLGCSAKFTTTNRRHHCRNCGQLFCKKCTTKKCYLPRFGFTQKKMRVCEKCFLKH